ncbi:hypothetical protein PG997_008301 [Apiospora hydei]|uniref:F-box domain-containing protein n=1 Tax=Apiospora hydei TaxID=1337664 RepID=A0ABR1WAJ7_9PEZI
MKAFLSHLRRPAASSSTTSSQSLPEYPSLVNSLPVELHLQIVSYLDQDDVIACLHTSHSLRHICESPSIWPALADRWYPGLSTQLRLTVPVSHCGPAFRRFLTRNRRRSQGWFLSSLHHGMCLEDDEYFSAPLSRALPVAQGGVHEYAAVPDLCPLTPPLATSTATVMGPEATGEHSDRGHQYTRLAHFVAYANGRIAWWPEAYSLPYFAIVDDLRTRQRRGYLFPGHGEDRTGYMTSLGDTMLLMARGRTLHAWNFAGEAGGAESLRSVVMPQRIARTLSENDTVLIVSQDGEVWLWRPCFHHESNHQQQKEEPPRKIDIASARCYVPGHLLSDRYDIRDIAYRACRVGLRIQQPLSLPPAVAPSSSSSSMSGGGDNDDDFEQQALVATTNNNNNNNVITLDFVLHPARRDIFFLATLQDRKLTVYEFSTDGTLLGTFLPDFPSPSLHSTNSIAASSTAATTMTPEEQQPNYLLPTRWAAHRGGLRWEKTSASGDFSLLPIWLGGQQTNGPFDATGTVATAGAPVICPQCCDAGFVAVCFNVYSKTFTSGSSSLEAFRLWNGCLTERLSATTAEEEWPLMVLQPCRRRRRRGRMTRETEEDQRQEGETGPGEAGHIPLYTTTQTGRHEDDHPLVARRHEASLQVNWRTWQTLPLDSQKRLRRIVKFTLDPDQIFAKDRVHRQGSNPTPSLGVQSLWGDDDFLIYMNDQVYTAWQFSS